MSYVRCPTSRRNRKPSATTVSNIGVSTIGISLGGYLPFHAPPFRLATVTSGSEQLRGRPLKFAGLPHLSLCLHGGFPPAHRLLSPVSQPLVVPLEWKEAAKHWQQATGALCGGVDPGAVDQLSCSWRLSRAGAGGKSCL